MTFSGPPGIEIDCAAATRLIGTPGCTLLDCREPDEYRTAAIAGGRLLPLGTLAAEVVRTFPDKTAAYIVYCHHGLRSLRAATMMRNLGYTNTWSLKGGIEEWSQCVDPSVARY